MSDQKWDKMKQNGQCKKTIPSRHKVYERDKIKAWAAGVVWKPVDTTSALTGKY